MQLLTQGFPQSLSLEGKWALNNVVMLLEGTVENKDWADKGALPGLTTGGARQLLKSLLRSEGR